MIYFQTEDQKRIMNICLDKMISSSAVITLNEIRFTDPEAKDANTVEIDSRVSKNGKPQIYVMDKFVAMDIRYLTKDRNEMLSIRTVFRAYIERQTEAVKEDKGRLYQMVWNMTYVDEANSMIYRTMLINPVLCFMEEYNGDYVLHLLFDSENIAFFENPYDKVRLQAELQYEEVSRIEAAMKHSSSSSEMDDNDDTDSYYIDEDV